MNKILLKLTVGECEDIYEAKNEIEKAHKLVAILFKDKVDLLGKPYISHLERVADNVPKNYKAIAYLHDVLEDIEDITEEDLLDIGFTKRTVNTVKLLTNDKLKGDFLPITKEEKLENYHNKITSIIENKGNGALIVKYADMSDNFDTMRLNELSESTKEYLHSKYSKEIVRLKEEMIKRDLLK